MPSVTDYLRPEELKSIKGLQLMAKRMVEGFISGQHRSPHKGVSIEFAQHREYVQGDEIRRVDWKVYAKTDRYYVREYEEETNLRTTILLDASGSMRYAGEGRASKHEYAVRTAAALAYLLISQRDSVGMITFDNEMRANIRPGSSMSHLFKMLGEMIKSEPGGETDLGDVFHLLIPRLKRRGMVIILSDFFGDMDSLIRSLAHFRTSGHEVILCHILDPDEAEFPFREWTRFENLEVTDHFRMVDPIHFRTAYIENFKKFEARLLRACRHNQMDLISLRTDQPFNEALAHYLARRQAGR